MRIKGRNENSLWSIRRISYDPKWSLNDIWPSTACRQLCSQCTSVKRSQICFAGSKMNDGFVRQNLDFEKLSFISSFYLDDLSRNRSCVDYLIQGFVDQNWSTSLDGISFIDKNFGALEAYKVCRLNSEGLNRGEICQL